jgi:D-amino-acid dehydrogenase
MHVAVIGAGITGLATAWQLTRDGHHVTLVDAAGGPARGASEQNGAQLSYGFVAPLASPSTLRQLPALLLDPASPLRLSAAAVWQSRRWCWQFVRACRQAQVERTTRALLSLAALSRERFAGWRAGVSAEDIEFERNGKLVLYRTSAALEGAARQLALQAPHGPPQQLLSPADCLATEPALCADSAPLAGGVWTPSEEVADCAKVCLALATTPGLRTRWSTRALGWQMQDGDVRGLRCQDANRDDVLLTADAYVVASGAAAPDLLKPLGVAPAIAPLKGYSIEVPAAALAQVPQVSVTDSAAKIVFAPLGQDADRRLRVAGMAELAGHDRHIDPRRIAQLRDAVAGRFGLRDDTGFDLRPWTGLRPATPTGLPMIGRSPAQPRVYVNAGPGGLGFTLAFGSAALLAAALAGQPPPLGGGEEFRVGLAA